jgi:DNA repair protein SbcD/Mre11
MPATPPFRILHTADWHLGKLLGDLPREQEHQRFLDFLLEQILAHSIDALLIAGDVFDSANPPQSAIAQYYNFLSRVHQQSHCHVVVIAGNHDSPAHIEAPSPILKALRTHVIGQWQNDPTAHLIPLPNANAPRVTISAVPFLRDRDLRSGISGQSPAEIQTTLNASITAIYQSIATAADHKTPLIAMGHLTVIGASPSDSEREIHIGGLGALPARNFPSAFTYVALGHLHRPQACGTCESIRYSGSPIPLSFSECQDQKELRLLEISNDASLCQSSIPIPASRRLVRKSCHSHELEACLAQLHRDHAADTLPAWVELSLTDAIVTESLHAQIRDQTRDAPFEIIRVLQTRATALAEIHAEGHDDHHWFDSQLGHPEVIFSKRLELASELTDEQKALLQRHFQTLLALHRGE